MGICMDGDGWCIGDEQYALQSAASAAQVNQVVPEPITVILNPCSPVAPVVSANGESARLEAKPNDELRVVKGEPMEPEIRLSDDAREKIRSVLVDEGHASALIATPDELDNVAAQVLGGQSMSQLNSIDRLAEAVAGKLEPQMAAWREVSALPPVTPGTVRVRIPKGLTERQILERLPEKLKNVPGNKSIEKVFGLENAPGWLVPCVVEYSMVPPEARFPGTIDCVKFALLYLAFVPIDVRRSFGTVSTAIRYSNGKQLVFSSNEWLLLEPDEICHVLYFRRIFTEIF